MKTNPHMCLLGKAKMLKPLRFKSQEMHWSDGFRQSGIFEIIGKEGDPKNPDNPICTIKRIATCRVDCPLGETWRIPESWLTKEMVTAYELVFHPSAILSSDWAQKKRS